MPKWHILGKSILNPFAALYSEGGLYDLIRLQSCLEGLTSLLYSPALFPNVCVKFCRIGRLRHCLPAHHFHPLQRPGIHPFSVLLRGLACPDGWVGLKGHPSQKVQTCSSGDRDPALLLVGSHGEALASKLALLLLTHPKLQSLGKGKFCHSELWTYLSESEEQCGIKGTGIGQSWEAWLLIRLCL